MLGPKDVDYHLDKRKLNKTGKFEIIQNENNYNKILDNLAKTFIIKSK